VKIRVRPRALHTLGRYGSQSRRQTRGQPSRRSLPPCIRRSGRDTLNYMVQCSTVRLDASFGALSDATRRGVLEQLGRADSSITELAETFHMTLTVSRSTSSSWTRRARGHREGRARQNLQTAPAPAGGRDRLDRGVPSALGVSLRRPGRDHGVDELFSSQGMSTAPRTTQSIRRRLPWARYA
jgi:DNA-binding transcriptional ArsR family regulator